MAGRKQNKRLMLQPAELVREMTCIVWADSLEKIYGSESDDWYWRLVGKLNSLHTECVVSPIHGDDYYDNEDIDKWFQSSDNVDDLGQPLPGRIPPKLGEPKKRHVHIYLSFTGNKTPEQVTQLIEGLWAVDGVLQDDRITSGRWQRVLRRDTLIRYFCHMDEPESGPLAKMHYPADHVISLGGADLSCLMRTDKLAKTQTSIEVVKAIKANNYLFYCDLLDWAISIGDYEVYNSVWGCGTIYSSYLNSRLSKKRAEEEREKDSDEGSAEHK